MAVEQLLCLFPFHSSHYMGRAAHCPCGGVYFGVSGVLVSSRVVWFFGMSQSPPVHSFFLRFAGLSYVPSCCSSVCASTTGLAFQLFYGQHCAYSWLCVHAFWHDYVFCCEPDQPAAVGILLHVHMTVLAGHLGCLCAVRRSVPDFFCCPMCRLWFSSGFARDTEVFHPALPCTVACHSLPPGRGGE